MDKILKRKLVQDTREWPKQKQLSNKKVKKATDTYNIREWAKSFTKEHILNDLLYMKFENRKN